jgi:hypothetical protein
MRKVPTPSGPYPFQLYFDDLGPDNLGCTIFNSSGAVQAILVSRSLEEQNTTPGRRRVRSTVAHEAGHGLLHGPLFAAGTSPELEKTNGASCAGRKTSWWRQSDRIEADGGNSSKPGDRKPSPAGTARERFFGAVRRSRQRTVFTAHEKLVSSRRRDVTLLGKDLIFEFIWLRRSDKKLLSELLAKISAHQSLLLIYPQIAKQ